MSLNRWNNYERMTNNLFLIKGSLRDIPILEVSPTKNFAHTANILYQTTTATSFSGINCGASVLGFIPKIHQVYRVPERIEYFGGFKKEPVLFNIGNVTDICTLQEFKEL